MASKAQTLSKGTRTPTRAMANMAPATSLAISQFEMAPAAFDPMGMKGFMPVEESYTSPSRLSVLSMMRPTRAGYRPQTLKMIPVGSLFDILAATDASKDPNASSLIQNPAKASVGRLIEVDEDDKDFGEHDWKKGPKETVRCLKLALKCHRTGKMCIGVELAPMNWPGDAESLVGKQLRIITEEYYYQDTNILLTGFNCTVTANSAGSFQPQAASSAASIDFTDFRPFQPTAPSAPAVSNQFDSVDDDFFEHEVINID